MSTYTFVGDDNESSLSIRTSPCSSPLFSVSVAEQSSATNNLQHGFPACETQPTATGLRPLVASHNPPSTGESSPIVGPETPTNKVPSETGWIADSGDGDSRISFQAAGANSYSHSEHSMVRRWVEDAANGSHDVTHTDLNAVGSGVMSEVGPATASDATETISWGSFQQAGIAQGTLEASGESAALAEDPFGNSSQNAGRDHQAVRIGEGSVTTRLCGHMNPTDETANQDWWDSYVEVLLLVREEAEAWDDEARRRYFDVEP